MIQLLQKNKTNNQAFPCVLLMLDSSYLISEHPPSSLKNRRHSPCRACSVQIAAQSLPAT